MLLILLSIANAVLAVRNRPYYANTGLAVRNRPYYAARKGMEINLNETFFSSLENYQVNATAATEVTYPWIAKVIHSRVNDGPYMCTASCLKKRIFVTAARCIYSLKIQQTRVIYQKSHPLTVLSFVLPSHGTKQAFDDLGLIVTTDTKFDNWKVIPLYGTKNRTDDAFEWFKVMPKMGLAVGYATAKGLHRIKSPHIQYNLTELNVVTGIDLCDILNFRQKLKGFKVPCYHSCTVEQFNKKNKLCTKYHGVEGSAILDAKTKKLLGVTTWGALNKNNELPAGLSVPNSANFYEDYKCAMKIANSKVSNVTNLQNICT